MIDAARRCVCGGSWPCPDRFAPGYRLEAYARHEPEPRSLPSPGESAGFDALVDALAGLLADAAGKNVYCSGCNDTPCDGYAQRVRRVLETHL